MIACQNGYKAVAKLLLDLSDPNNDLNARNNIGWTALMQACNNGHKDVVKCEPHLPQCFAQSAEGSEPHLGPNQRGKNGSNGWREKQPQNSLKTASNWPLGQQFNKNPDRSEEQHWSSNKK